MGAKAVKQLHLIVPDKVGMLAEITGLITGTGVNIETLLGYPEEGKAHLLIITGDNAKAMDALKNYEVKEDDAVVVEMENKVGAAAEMGNKLKEANINLYYIYGTTCGTGPATAVFRSDNDTKAVEVLS